MRQCPLFVFFAVTRLAEASGWLSFPTPFAPQFPVALDQCVMASAELTASWNTPFHHA
jgi:hypothetical protein